jgi:hypothetical protein
MSREYLPEDTAVPPSAVEDRLQRRAEDLGCSGDLEGWRTLEDNHYSDEPAFFRGLPVILE